LLLEKLLEFLDKLLEIFRFYLSIVRSDISLSFLKSQLKYFFLFLKYLIFIKNNFFKNLFLLYLILGAIIFSADLAYCI